MTEWDKLARSTEWSRSVNRLTPPHCVQRAKFDTPDPTSAVLRELGIEHPTLQDWLEFNGCEDDTDAELLDVIPPEFADEYIERVRRRAGVCRQCDSAGGCTD